MNQTLIKAILLLIAFTLSCHTPLFSQRDFERHEFSFHAGYGVMFHHPPTLTLSTHSYQRTLAQGVSWDGQYNFVSVSAILSCRPFFILIFLLCIKMKHYGFSRKSIWKNLETFP